MINARSINPKGKGNRAPRTAKQKAAARKNAQVLGKQRASPKQKAAARVVEKKAATEDQKAAEKTVGEKTATEDQKAAAKVV